MFCLSRSGYQEKGSGSARSRRVGQERFGELRKRVADEIDTTFESKYSDIISLEQALSPDCILSYTKQATGEKYLIKPDS